ncbi:MAG: hypothetical protein FWH48_04925, partial [Oscillospiraceae bacterium]|nr:hypothetical protein [Oscillospiraceae bacterium]
KSRLLDYNKALYGEARQTRRYTKALYMMTSDENIKVDIKEEPPEAASNKAGDISSDAFSKIKSSPIRKDPKPALQRPKPNEESKKLEAPKPQEIDTAYEQKELDIFAETETETKPEPESEPEFEPETNEQDFDPEDC